MTGKPESLVKDKNYNLFSAMQQSLQNVWQMETYIQDAERGKDSELSTTQS